MPPQQQQHLHYNDDDDIMEMGEKGLSSKQQQQQKELLADTISNEYVLNVAFFTFVGFLSVQAVFALIAHSHAMLADCEAMVVDAVTYLFNLLAERIKQRPYSEKELELTNDVLEYKRERERLYLELIPPAVSVTTLILVTIGTLHEACTSLFFSNRDDSSGGTGGEEVSVSIMLIFSGANLILDIVNVTCFARANFAYGLVGVTAGTDKDNHEDTSLPANEQTHLLTGASPGDAEASDTSAKNHQHPCACDDESLNLNMCSAWTHVCADTMRSTAVLVAAAIAFFAGVDGDLADDVASVAVSLIIFGSLLPLLRGLHKTIVQIRDLAEPVSSTVISL